MYAMKHVNKMVCIQKDAFRNVMREIELLVDLAHPFLVNLWFSFQDSEDMFLVFDLLLGGDLRFHLNQCGRFSESRVKLYVCEVAMGLDYLRKQRIVHRDIKPDNILLDDNGHAHITDFNIATKLGDNSLATSLTGTRPYIAPEIFRVALHSCPGYDYAVDWWSLGICVYEMLRGRRPFDINMNMSSKEALSAYRAPLAVSVEWSPDVVSLLNSLLCPEPENRLCTLDALQAHPFLSDIRLEDVLRRRIQPVYVPPKDSLNCDPTFELEEMIIESRPLHKKKKRQQQLQQQQALNGGENVNDPMQEALDNMQRQFKDYNREKLLRDEEARIRKLEEELGLRLPLQADAISKRLGRLDS